MALPCEILTTPPWVVRTPSDTETSLAKPADFVSAPRLLTAVLDTNFSALLRAAWGSASWTWTTRRLSQLLVTLRRKHLAVSIERVLDT